MSKYLFGIFAQNVEVFGLIVIILLIIIGLIVYLVVKTAIKKVQQLETFHDDVIIVKQQDEGRKSFTDTIVRHNILIEQHEKRLDKIDERLDRRTEQRSFEGDDKRK